MESVVGVLYKEMSRILLLIAVLSSCPWVTVLSQVQNKAYTFLYGGIVGQEIANVTERDSDVSLAVEHALDSLQLWKLNDGFMLKGIRKHRLLFTKDHQSPHLFREVVPLNGKVRVQQFQLVLGLQYTFSALWQRGSLCDHCPQVERKFAVTRDKNNKYHLFQHTSSSQGEHCSRTDHPPLHSDVNRKHQENLVSSQIHTEYSYSSYLNYFTSWVYTSTIQSAFSKSTSLCAKVPDVARDRARHHSSLHCDNPQDQCKALKIVTYNIWNVNGLNDLGEVYEDRLQRMGKHLTSMDADIIGFQEVRFNVPVKDSRTSSKTRSKALPTRSQVTHLSKYLKGYEFVYQPAMLFPDQLPQRNEEGVAIFSRYPIISSDYILLYRNASDEHNDRHQRVCLHAEIFIPSLGKVHVFVTHLSLSESSQERSVVEIWKYMESYSGLKILLGDLNAEPHSTPIRFLLGVIPLEGVKTHHLCDVWTTFGSNHSEYGFTYTALETPLKRIDYAFISQPESPLVHITSVRVLDKDPSCSEPCSDHYALAVEFLPAQCS